MRYQNIRSALFSFLTIHASDGQTDGQTEFRQQYRALHYMQSHGKNGRLDQYGAGPFEQQQFRLAGVERVKACFCSLVATVLLAPATAPVTLYGR